MSAPSAASRILPSEQFTGELIIDEQRVPISLTASAGPSGRLELDVEPIPPSATASGIRALARSFGEPGNTIGELSLECETSDGKRLTSESVHLTAYNHHSDGVHIQLRTGEASLRMTASDTYDRQVLRFWLLGFTCFP